MDFSLGKKEADSYDIRWEMLLVSALKMCERKIERKNRLKIGTVYKEEGLCRVIFSLKTRMYLALY